MKTTILAKVKTTVVGVTAVRARGGRLPNAWNVCGRLKRAKQMQKQMDLSNLMRNYTNSKYNLEHRGPKL